MQQVKSGTVHDIDHGGSARIEFTRRLSALHRAAGGPSLRNVAMLAQQRATAGGQPAPASAQRISDWINGRNVPARFESLQPVLQVLGARARRRAGTPSETVNLRAWRMLWAAARTAPAVAPAARARAAFPKTSGYCARAEQVWGTLSPAEQFDAQQLLLTLITVHRDGVLPRRAPLAELRRIADRSATGPVLVERLVRARLIRLEPRHASLIHDALLRWDRLRGWIAENRSMLFWRQRIEEDAAEWDCASRDPGLLYRSIRLTTAINHADPALNPVATEFLRASVQLGLDAPDNHAVFDLQNVGGHPLA